MRFKSKLFVKLLLGYDEGFLCTQIPTAVQCFQYYSLTQAHSSVFGDGTDRLHIGIIRALVVPAGAVGCKFSGTVYHRKAQLRTSVRWQYLVSQHFLQFRLITLVVKALPDNSLISKVILREMNLANSKSIGQILIHTAIQVPAKDGLHLLGFLIAKAVQKLLHQDICVIHCNTKAVFITQPPISIVQNLMQ